MIPIYIINLDKDTERLSSVTGQLNALGLSWERIPAVRGTDISPELLAKENQRTRDRKLSFMELGCLLSHVNIWRKLPDSNIKALLVLEDDVVLASDLPSLLHDLSWLPSDDCIIRLETFCMAGVYGKKVSTVSGRDLYPLRSIQHGGAAYIITQKRAAALLVEYEKYIDAADHIIFRYPQQHNVFQLSPAPAIQLGILRDGHIRTHSVIEFERSILKRQSLCDISTMRQHLWWRISSILHILWDVLRGYRLQKVPYKG